MSQCKNFIYMEINYNNKEENGMNNEMNFPSWDAQDWIKSFRATRHKCRSLRKDVFTSTIEIVKAERYLSADGTKVELYNVWNNNPLQSNVFCDREINLINPERKYNTVVKVINKDCLAHAKELLEQDSTPDVCVLNMASAKIPGGGVYDGAGAQEEYLFRCSDYFRFLYQYANPTSFDCEKEYGIPHHSRHCYPLKDDFGGIFSRGVTIFRDTEANGYALLEAPWQVNFVAVAALNLKHGMPHDYESSTKNRIRSILRIAYKNGQRRLVLGAFGCGAFANDPCYLANFFKLVLDEPEFKGLFSEIDFAIIEDHNSGGRNFKAFSEAFLTPISNNMNIGQNDQSTIENLLRSTGRTGINNVIEHLRRGGFYSVPASQKKHHNYKGGLAKHSLEVYKIAMEFYEELKSSGIEYSFDENSVILCSLLHDVCKMDEYTIYRDGTAHHTKRYYENKTRRHGTKSVDLLTSWGLELTQEEIKAIHWHMGSWAPHARELYKQSYFIASLNSILVYLIHTADSSSANSNKKHN